MSASSISNRLVMDPTSTERIAELSHRDPKAAMKAVAGQFEALLLNQLVSAMRENPLGGDDDSAEMGTFRNMYDQQVVQGLVERGGLGLADMLSQQLLRAANLSDTRQELPPAALQLPPVAATRLQQAYGQAPQPAAPAASVAGNVAADTTDKLPSDRQGFVAALLPHAQAAADKLGVVPEVLVAHAALESGWGQRMLRQPDGSNSFNLFGIKATGNWQGDTVAALTTEYEGGKPRKQVDNFRAYSSYAQAFDDYAQLIGNSSRYRQALNQGSNAGAYASALQRGGYATDPDYASKLQAVARHVAAL